MLGRPRSLRCSNTSSSSSVETSVRPELGHRRRAPRRKELNFKQIECFTIGSDGVIDKAAATSAALKVSLLVGSLRNDPRFGFRWRGPPPKLLLKVVSVGFALTALVPSALSAVDPYAAREVGSG